MAGLPPRTETLDVNARPIPSPAPPASSQS
jgi:hypothetical protein